jgi:hypothetical protein
MGTHTYKKEIPKKSPPEGMKGQSKKSQAIQ